MKTFILLAVLICTQAYGAFDVCKFEETFELTEAMEKSGKLTKTSNNHKHFTKTEKNLIFEAIESDEMYSGTITEAEALNIFGDYYDGSQTTGSNAGEISYYTVGKQKFIIVHYWPGDNEYGGIFEVKNGKAAHIAIIGDSFIECI